MQPRGIQHKRYKKLVKPIILAVFFGGLSITLTGQSSNSYKIEKCSRLNTGIIYSQSDFDGQKFSPGFYIQHNYCLKPVEHFGFGAGAGIIKYKEQTFLPVYFDFLACQGSNFYFNVQAGYSLGWKSNNTYYKGYSFNGGIYSQIGVGYKFRISDEFKTCLFIGYNHQYAGLNSTAFEDRALQFNSVVVTIGIMLEKE